MGPAESEIEALRRRLRSGETSLLDKYSGRIDAVERVRPVFVVGAGLGAALTAGSRFVADVPGIVLAVIGITAALIFGGLVGWADFRKLEISREAREALTIAEDALDRAAADAAALDEQSRRRERREERLRAGELMREAISLGLVSGLMIGDALDAMLAAARLRLVSACGFDAAEYWAVTIFAVTDAGDKMGKIAALWNDVTASARPSRSWHKGEGFTGVAWQVGGPIVVPDVEAASVADAFRLPEEQQRAHDRVRYRSAAAMPVFVDNVVWGIVTATSDRAGRFDLAAAEGAEAVEAIRDVTHYAALLAIMDRLVDDEEAEDE
jgi:GAF domain-containing protein